jgi:hypothetical protein
MKRIQTKDGRDMDCRDVMVFDQTNTGLPVCLWNTETVHRAEHWRPRETGSFVLSGLYGVLVTIINLVFIVTKGLCS